MNVATNAQSAEQLQLILRGLLTTPLGFASQAEGRRKRGRKKEKEGEREGGQKPSRMTLGC